MTLKTLTTNSDLISSTKMVRPKERKFLMARDEILSLFLDDVLLIDFISLLFLFMDPTYGFCCDWLIKKFVTFVDKIFEAPIIFNGQI